jgi:hypothetical protein
MIWNVSISAIFVARPRAHSRQGMNARGLTGMLHL